MAVKNCGGAIPKPGGSGGGGGDEGAGTAYSAQLTEDDKALLASASECLDAVRPLVGKTQQLHKALEVILQVHVCRSDAHVFIPFFPRSV